MAAEETNEALAKVAEKLDEMTRILGRTNTSTGRLSLGLDGLSEKTKKSEKAMHLAADAGGKLAESFVSAASAMYRGEKGMSAFNQSIEKVGDALQVVAVIVGLLGGPIAKVAALFGGLVVAGIKYTKAVNEQSDALYKAYQDISKAGAVGSDGIQGIYVDMQKLGLGVQDLGKMVEMIAANSKDLASFGGSVNQGRKQFANIGQAMDQYRLSLYNLGMNQDDLNQGIASYTRLQNRMGGIQSRSVDEMAESTKKYLLEQDALTRLTGMSRQEQEKAREEYLSQERFAAAIQQMRQQGRDKEATELLNYVTTMRQYNRVAAQGIADAASGNLQTKAAQQAVRATNAEVLRNISNIKSGQMSYVEAMDTDVDARKRFIDAVGTQQALVGNYNEIAGDYAGDLEAFAAKQKGSFASRKALEDKDQAATAAGVNAEVKRQSEMRITQMRAMHATQDFVRAGVEPATKATKTFGEVISKATQLLPGAGASGTTGATGIGGAAPSGGASGFLSKIFGGFGRPGATTASQEDLAKMGLRIKQGDVQADNATISPKLIELATKIQNSLPDFAYFSGFNDRFHQEKSPSSTHTKGLAADFALTSPPSKERGQEIVSMLKSMGASVVIDEYNNPSRNATAGHIHVQIPEFELGGLVKGPDSGYMARLHGTEAVIPLDNNQGNFIEMFEEIAVNTRSTNMLLEELVRSQKNSVDVQSKILRAQM